MFAQWLQPDIIKMARSNAPGRQVTMWFGNWMSRPQQLTMRFAEGFRLSSLFWNVCTKGLTYLNNSDLSQLTLADDWLTYKTIPDTYTEVTTGKKCQETGPRSTQERRKHYGAPSIAKEQDRQCPRYASAKKLYSLLRAPDTLESTLTRGTNADR